LDHLIILETALRLSEIKSLHKYDASGNRISKKYTSPSAGSVTTYYLRDPQGNVLSTYHDSSGTLSWHEQHLYGSSRLGMVNIHAPVSTDPVAVSESTAYIYDSSLIGQKVYELSNHLGNVLTTISDKKGGVDVNTDGVTDHYLPEVITANDYYPYGMLQPGRQFSLADYRYGFNGKENDNEVKGGDGLQQDYGMRIYDNRLGRFLSVDPLNKSYPMLTPYQFASNRPIDGIDLDGMEWKKTVSYDVKSGVTNIHFQVKIKILNCSQYTGSMFVLGDEFAKAFKEAFDGVYDEKRKIKYSASAEYEITGSDLTSDDYGVELNDAKRAKVGGTFISGMNVQAPNTQKNVVGAAGAIETEGSSEVVQRKPSVIAKTMLHELVHTANVTHPMDDENTAEDVDLSPTKYNGNDGKVRRTFTPSAGAKKALILSNIMIYTITGFNGSTVGQIIKDSEKLKKVSPDQAYIIQKQISEDQNKKTSKSSDNANP
jgi:RHS repeat-associated protein